ncbi:hypothetical protein HDV04_004269 [Boothiomyces sp. JEL0838]|nr:hypothetical protein HDV04_004269 [Boothiomyces sp. JEL0838]
MRDFNAYGTPSGIFLGLAFHDFATASVILFSKLDSAKSFLWQSSFFTWIILALFIIAQFIGLDYFMSPYELTNIGYVLVANYLLNILTTLGITTMMVYRVKIFFGKSSTIFKVMIAFQLIVLAFKGVGSFFGCLVSYQFQTGVSQLATNVHFRDIGLFEAIGQAAEGIFSACGSTAFIYALTSSHSKQRQKTFADIAVTPIGMRLIAILLLNFTIAVFGVWDYFDDNYIDHTGFFMPSWTYALQLHTFLDLSYISAKKIVFGQVSSSYKMSGKDNSA